MHLVFAKQVNRTLHALWLDNNKYISTAILYILAFMCHSALAFFQIQGIFHYFRPFETEIRHMYSLTGQILKQLSPSVSVTSYGYLPHRFVAW